MNQKVREQGGIIPNLVDGVEEQYSYDGAAKISDDANSWERRHVITFTSNTARQWFSGVSAG